MKSWFCAYLQAVRLKDYDTRVGACSQPGYRSLLNIARQRDIDGASAPEMRTAKNM